jgi:hypothetical protein
MPETEKARGGKSRVLTPEQSAIWRREHRGDIKGKSKEERRAFRDKNLEKLAAMSEPEKTSLRNQLQAKWNALPAEEKKKLEQKISERGAGGGGKKKKKKKGGGGGGGDD